MRSIGKGTLFVLLLAAVFAAGFWFGGAGVPHNPSPAASLSSAARAVTPAATSTTTAAAASSPGAAPPSALVAVAPARAVELDVKWALRTPSLAERSLRFAELLRKLTPENWREALAAIEAETKLSGRMYPDELALFASRVGEIAGREGAELFAARKDYDLLRKVLTTWAGRQPQDALNWIARDADEDTRQTVKGAVIRGMTATEPELAMAALEAIPLRGRENYVINFAGTLVQNLGIAQAEVVVEAMAKRAVAQGSGEEVYIKKVVADFATLKLEHALRNGAARPALEWLGQNFGQPYFDRSVITEAAAVYSRSDPMAALAWLQDFNRASSSRNPTDTIGYQGLLYGWAQRDGAAAVGQWLLTNPDTRNYDRLAVNYAMGLATQDPKAATEWANAIPNAAVKKQALEGVQRAGNAKR